MNWFVVWGWVIFSLKALGTLVYIAEIGNPRKPITPKDAVTSTVINGLILIWIYLAMTR